MSKTHQNFCTSKVTQLQLARMRVDLLQKNGFMLY